MKGRILSILLFAGMCPALANEVPVTLDSCRNMALRNNKELRMAEMEKKAAFYNRKSASTSYLPKVAVAGMYMHTGKELSLLSDEQKATLSHIGDAFSMPQLNVVGAGLVDALHTDTRNMTGAAVVLTQPIYMGGKIKAYNQIMKYAEKIAADKYDQRHQETVVAVDETYWTIIQLSARKRLADKYLDLVESLQGDVERMMQEGFATKADVLSVKVKANEARVSIIQVDNGIGLLKTRMCQLCGLPLDTDILLAGENDESRPAAEQEMDLKSDIEKNRPELSALSTAQKIRDEKVKVARAEFLPSLALTGGYFANYPSVFNSFEKRFKGTWNVGVGVNIPVLTWGDRFYKVRAAKADAAASRMEYEETREKIELQVSQCRRKVREARERYVASESNQKSADENLRYATLGYREGVIPVINVIEAQTAWLSAKTDFISADIDLRLAYTYLRKSLGIIR